MDPTLLEKFGTNAHVLNGKIDEWDNLESQLKVPLAAGSLGIRVPSL